MTRVIFSPSWVGDKSRPILAFQNVFRTATYSGAGISGSALSARSPFTYNYWEGEDGQNLSAAMPVDVTFDYIAVYFRDATYTTGLTFTFELFDGFSTAIYTPIAITEQEGCILFVIPPESNYKGIRLYIGGGAGNSAKVCNFKAGLLLSLPTGLPIGYEPGALNLDVVTTNVESEGGQILGSNVERSGVNESLNFTAIPEEWIRDNWQPKRVEARKEGMYYTWAPLWYPDDLLYGIVTGQIRIRYSSVVAQDLTFNLRGPNNGL